MWRRLRTLVPFITAHWRAYTLGFVCLLISNGFSVAGPRFVEAAINAIARKAPTPEILRAAGLIVLLAAVGGVARFIMRQTLNTGSRRVETDLRGHLFRHLQTLPAAFYDRSPTGDLMARTTNDLLALRMVAGPAIMYLVDTTVRAALIIPAMMTISPRLALLAALPLLGLPLVMTLLGNRIHYRSLAIQDQFGEITSFVHEHLSGVRVVRAYGQEAAECATFEALNADYRERNLALARVQGLFHPLLTISGGLGGVFVIGLGGRMVLEGTVTVGAFVAFGVYLAMLVWPMIALGWALNLVQRGAAAMVRVDALLAEPRTIASPAEATPLPPRDGARSVTFEDVWFRHPNAPERGWLLQGISFHVPAGETLAITGTTGAGKTTLVELLVRTFDPDRGCIRIDGVDIRELPLAELRRTVGFVPQDTFLFSETLRDNVLLGAPNDGRLERVGDISQLSAALPDLPYGWDTMLGERGINLSGGQKQRTAIGRALAQDPPVFALDDALSAVDAQTEARILENLRGALHGRTVLLVSHRLAAVRDAEQILVLESGMIVQRGTHAQLASAPGRFRDLLQRQAVEQELESAPAATA
jgi:ATP-binding cassette subfamily B protein